MGECKNALSATYEDGQFSMEKALKHLRTSGAIKISAKTASRAANEGSVAIKTFNKKQEEGGVHDAVVALSMGCETDFAAKGEVFVSLIRNVVNNVAANTSSPSFENILTNGQNVTAPPTTDSEGQVAATINPKLTELLSDAEVKSMWDNAALTVRENMTLRNFAAASNADNMFVSYVHSKVADAFKTSVDVGSVAAVVQVSKLAGSSTTNEEVQAIGKQLAMHVVASKPKYLSITDIPEGVKNEELATQHATTLVSDPKFDKKPKDIQEKIVNGKMSKFYQLVCLLEQEHLVDSDGGKVGKLLAKKGVECKGFYLLE